MGNSGDKCMLCHKNHAVIEYDYDLCQSCFDNEEKRLCISLFGDG